MPALVPRLRCHSIPKLRPARNLPQPTTHITTLKNGLRVVSEENYGQVSGVGLFVDSGSMYEDGACTAPERARVRVRARLTQDARVVALCTCAEITLGSNHFLEILAFQSTANRTAEQVTT